MGKRSAVRVKQVAPKAAVNPFQEGFAVPPEDMIAMPSKPADSNVSHVWPMNETFSMEYKQFSVIFPSYLDANKTVKRGRRISAEDAVPNPSALDIGEALQSMGIRHVVQPYKGYSRDPESLWDNLGRVLVDMEKRGPVEFDADAMPDISDDSSGAWKKKPLMREICKRIPHLPGRTRRLQEEERLQQEAKTKEEAARKTISQKASTPSTGGKKKKGKKKR